jgi:hypothetical protein
MNAITDAAKLISKASYAISAMVSWALCITALQFIARQLPLHYLEQDYGKQLFQLRLL